MPITTIKGIYRDGKVEFLEAPPAGNDIPVQVRFLKTKPKRAKGRKMRHGIFKGAIDTTEDDFKIAEWHGEKRLEQELNG